MAKLVQFDAKLKYKSGEGNTFDDRYASTKENGVPALISTIQKLAYIAKVAGVQDQAEQAFNDAMKGGE